jgi:uncharacterized NAD-dependent epimerase/dehydratase family protein
MDQFLIRLFEVVFIKRVLIHHFDQNAHAMVMFGKDIKILGIYDERTKFQGRDAGEALGLRKLGIYIFDDFDKMLERFSKQADILVTTGEGLFFTKPENVERWKRNITKAMKLGLDVYTMSKIWYGEKTKRFKEIAKREGVRFIEASDPKGFERFKRFALLGAEEGVKTKTILFGGTSMNSGKITAMLVMRDFFEKKGLEVGVVGTEPCSVFVGSDEQVVPEVLPTMRGAHAILGAVKKVEIEKKPDVIFVGSQTGLRASATDVLQSRAGAVVAWQILLGSKADKIVLCTKWKMLEEIKPHLELIKNSGLKTEVVANVINGSGCERDRLLEIIEKVEKEFGLLCLDVFATPEKLGRLGELILE